MGYPKIISESFYGLNAKNGFDGKLDATFTWGGNKQAYFVAGNKYWRFNFQAGSVENGYPKNLSIWSGLSGKVTDAFLWTNGVTYFFSDENYFRFNDRQFQVEKTLSIYPRPNMNAWFDCKELNSLSGIEIILITFTVVELTRKMGKI